MAVSLSKVPKIKNPVLSMGLNAPLIYSSLKLYSNAGEFNFNGPAFDQLAWAIAHAVAEWIDNPSNVALAGLAAGTAGVGYIPEHTSHLIVLPVVPLMTMSMEAAGMNGPLMPSLSIVVTLAISHVITQFGGYTGICPTVGVGTDMSKVVIANVGALVEQLVQEMKGQNMTGPANLRMANGLGMGIAALVLTGFGWGVVVGVPSPVPSSGPSLSKVG